ncbi:DedA family protein [Candidatus Peregrinibacteria bacterium]|nr:DedA family protein [Candidatus Peregrinibacteria bacterium]
MIDFILHFDKYLGAIIASYGLLTYAILFLIIFAETGLVFTPLLPGDSLIFVAGTFAATGALSLEWLFPLIAIAAVAGDTVNYFIGRFIGKKITVKRDYMLRTQHFYDKYGKKTIFLARFVPIVRTFAPFVAGIGKMDYRSFALYNVVGGIAWTGLFSFAGYYFGNVPVVKENLTLVILGIIFLSILPPIYELWYNRKI